MAPRSTQCTCCVQVDANKGADPTESFFVIWRELQSHAAYAMRLGRLKLAYCSLVRRQIANATGVQCRGCTLLHGPQSKSGIKNQSIRYQSKKQDAKRRIQKLLLDYKARRKKQEAKCQVSDDWTLNSQ